MLGLAPVCPCTGETSLRDHESVGTHVGLEALNCIDFFWKQAPLLRSWSCGIFTSIPEHKPQATNSLTLVAGGIYPDELEPSLRIPEVTSPGPVKGFEDQV